MIFSIHFYFRSKMTLFQLIYTLHMKTKLLNNIYVLCIKEYILYLNKLEKHIQGFTWALLSWSYGTN